MCVYIYTCKYIDIDIDMDVDIDIKKLRRASCLASSRGARKQHWSAV